jgi:hypothetical protein
MILSVLQALLDILAIYCGNLKIGPSYLLDLPIVRTCQTSRCFDDANNARPGSIGPVIPCRDRSPRVDPVINCSACAAA